MQCTSNHLEADDLLLSSMYSKCVTTHVHKGMYL